MNNTIRIATRGSALALWQANAVKHSLEKNGCNCEIITVKSSGDLNLSQPIYTLGIAGVFTKELDAALLNHQADIAVHSLKDVPTQLAKRLALAATLPRGAHQDVALIKNNRILEKNLVTASVATCSLRRRAQWLEKFPHHKTIDIRGSVETRLKKFYESNEMDAVILAKAGLERLNLLPESAIVLDWMLPAPAQGIVGVVCRNDDDEMINICNEINDEPSFKAATIERQFMQTLQAGCSVPVSALAMVHENEVHFSGAVHDFDGASSFLIEGKTTIQNWENAGKKFALSLLNQQGASVLLKKINDKKW